ncbi:type II toxin-antitoxin system RelE/ParE family toxin [Roseomonas sp. 18066]|uniref:type II toxin-antitoxin system RelE/ParE family toxin n=1 Tax=Roseomonas sp. 18066 TaxID=2681412 RepID=UPI001359A9CD
MRDHIGADNPAAANAVLARLRAAIDGLMQLPARRRPGRREGTRQPVVAGTAFVVVCRMSGDEIAALTVLHATRAWPAPSTATAARRRPSPAEWPRPALPGPPRR